MGLIPKHDRMSGVIPPLVSHHCICLFREQIHDFAFAFIPPLGTNHYQCRH
jgi:hypothetical protein